MSCPDQTEEQEAASEACQAILDSYNHVEYQEHQQTSRTSARAAQQSYGSR